MDPDWDGMESVEAAERILHAAVASGARQVHLSSDHDGAAVFFVSDERMEFYQHIPCLCRDSLNRYLRSIAAIDTWRPAPATGFGVFGVGGVERALEIRLLQANPSEDIIINIDDGG